QGAGQFMILKGRVCAVIMAGGSGTRFWPLSRKSRPKQFLPIAAEKTMIEETVERLLPLLPSEAIYAVSDRAQAQVIKRLIPEFPAENLLVEPLGKNTAASLILATAWVFRRDPETVILALPADHLIGKPKVFRRKLEAAAEAAAARDVIVTFGIPPTYPSTGFGYIHYAGRKPERIRGEIFYPVRRFKEKPSLEWAKAFLKQGSHCWNSGMFIWRAEVFADMLEKYAPDFFAFWQRILKALDQNDRPEIKAAFREIPATSIDYALMEKADGVLMNKGDFGWSDVGSWAALADIWTKDKAGNASRGECLFLDSRNCLVYNPRKLTTLVGLRDVVVVETEDALLICHKDSDQKVKEVIEALKKKGLNKLV
ncbi:MAG: mannose-1-phosphate guanylyltransferase, partial [Acidobacteriota bacterium]